METLGFFLIVLVAIGILIYFLPSIIAIGKYNWSGIFLLNLFLGWSVIGWVASLIWAICSPKKEEIVFISGCPYRR